VIARPSRRLQTLQRVLAIRGEPVKEVLRVEEHPQALRFEVAHRVGDHRQVLLGGGLQDVTHVPVVRLAHDGDDASASVHEGAKVGVRVRGGAGMTGRPEGGQLRVSQGQRAGPHEELGVLGVGARPAPLDVVDAHFVQHAGDLELVLNGEGDALHLSAVAEGSVV
jgi:hypothetical protein